MSKKLKLLISSTKDDGSEDVRSIVNHLCSITYSDLNLDEETKSPLRIVETTISNFQIEFWHLTDTKMINNLPAICTHNLNGLILVTNDSIMNFLNSNSLLFNKNRYLPILWLFKQFDSSIMDNIQLQSNYNIHQFNSSTTSLDLIQNEFNKWLIQNYSSIN